MTTYREYDSLTEYTYNKSSGLERLAFYSPSEQFNYFFHLAKTVQKPLPANPDEIQQRFNQQEFTELTIKDIGLYNKPPRG